MIVSRYNEMVTGRLLDGARRCLAEHGVPEGRVDVVWVPGAFELPVAAEAAAASGRYGLIVALGCVIRGETAHFDYVAGEAARGLGNVALAHRIAVGEYEQASPAFEVSEFRHTVGELQRMAQQAEARDVSTRAHIALRQLARFVGRHVVELLHGFHRAFEECGRSLTEAGGSDDDAGAERLGERRDVEDGVGQL